MHSGHQVEGVEKRSRIDGTCMLTYSKVYRQEDVDQKAHPTPTGYKSCQHEADSTRTAASFFDGSVAEATNQKSL
jgi:hypothetical protein